MSTTPLKRIESLRLHLVAAEAPQRLLEGLKVVELATVVAAPAASALLCDHGATVVKIESPSNPDISRGWGKGDSPYRTADPNLRAARGGGGSAFSQLNRGKLSIALDPTLPAGNKIARTLIGSADIFITNVRQQSLEKMGLDYTNLHKVHPRLIYGHLTAYGRAGAMQNDPGYDFGAFWAHTGVMEILRSADDAPMPRFPGAIGDNITASQLFGGILGALYHRERTGRGQLVDGCLLRAGVWALAHPIAQHAGGNAWAALVPPSTGVSARLLPRKMTGIGERRTFITNQPFRAADGVWLQLMGLEFRRHLPRTLAALGLRPEEVFAGDGEPNKDTDWAAATRVVDARFAQRPSTHWEAAFATHDVWYKRVNRLDQMLSDAQANAAGCFVNAPGPLKRAHS